MGSVETVGEDTPGALPQFSAGMGQWLGRVTARPTDLDVFKIGSDLFRMASYTSIGLELNGSRGTMAEKMHGIKTLEIVATTAYSIVSAYEYEFLKEEKIVQDKMNGATIYFILQRPLMYFDNLVVDDGFLQFDIVDGVNPPLHCGIDATDLGIPSDEEAILDVQYYRDNPSAEPPFKEVAAFKLLKSDGTFVVWETPQKLLYEAIANELPVSISGDVGAYLNYHVHYIGQAFSQKIWNRLTGHEKLQRILTLEAPLSSLTTRPPFEISILMLSIIGFDEAIVFPYPEALGVGGEKPILHAFDFEEDNENFEKFYVPFLSKDAPELTNEAEAILINLFKPEYNEKLFKNYPNIKKGARSAGYSEAQLTIERLPAVLSTKHHLQVSITGHPTPNVAL